MTSTMTGFSNWRAYPTDSRDGFLMMSVSRFWSYENRSSTRHSEASHSWIQRHVHLLTDSFGFVPVDEQQFGGSIVLEGTARDQHRLANIESNPSRVLGHLSRIFDLVFDSNVECPRLAMFLQAKFASFVLDSSSSKSSHKFRIHLMYAR